MPPVMSGPEARSVVVMDACPGVGFALLYLLTLSRSLSVTHDSALFLGPIEALEPGLLPNHLWFEPIMAAAYQLMRQAWPGVDAQTAVEAMNAVAGAMALQGAYAIGVWRIGLARPRALLVVASAGFTYGVWYYSTAIETYVLPLALTAWTFYWLTSPVLRWRSVMLCAVAQAVAILCHQSAVLFWTVATGALLTAAGTPRRRVSHLSAYVLVSLLLTGSAYASAAITTGHGDSMSSAVRWSLGLLPRRSYWSRPPRAFVQAAAGATRALVGGQFVFAVPSWAARAARWFPRNDPVDERFFVRTLPLPVAWLFGMLSVVAVGSLGTLMVMAGGALRATGPRRVARPTALLGLWFATYCSFFTLWDPANPDFWVVQVYLAPLVAAALLSSSERTTVQSWLLLALASSLLVVNGLGTVRLARDPGNDYYSIYLQSVVRELDPDDVLILGDHWPIRTHLERHEVDTIFLAVAIIGESPSDLAAKVHRLLDGGRRVFVAPDVLEVGSVSRAAYGARYTTYVQRLRDRICGLAPPVGGPDEMPLRQVTCFDSAVVNPARR